jgi:hypothetical protein
MRAKQILRRGQVVMFSALTLTALTAAGCIAVGGTDNYTQPTLGRQLQDLKVARDTGAVSDAEYADAKSKLISGEVPRKH